MKRRVSIVGAIALELLAVLFWFVLDPSTLARFKGTLAHLSACGLLGYAWSASLQDLNRQPKIIFQILLVMFFPGLGMPLALLLDQQPALGVDEMKALQTVEDAASAVAAPPPMQSPSWYKAAEIQPIADILSTTDMDLKREAIRRLSARPDPMSVRLLKRGLLDPQGEVRLYAINALGKIEEQMVNEVAKANREASLHPKVLASWMQLGEACRNYAQSGLLEGTLRTMYLGKALRAFERARSLFPESALALTEELRTAAEAGRTERVQALLALGQSLFPDEPALRLFRAQDAFESGRWNDLKKALEGVDSAMLAQLGVSPAVVSVWRI